MSVVMLIVVCTVSLFILYVLLLSVIMLSVVELITALMGMQPRTVLLKQEQHRSNHQSVPGAGLLNNKHNLIKNGMQ